MFPSPEPFAPPADSREPIRFLYRVLYACGALSHANPPAVGTSIYLGSWQLSRYRWKIDVIEQRRAALLAAPLDISETRLADIAAASDELQIVRVRGTLDLSRAVTISPRPPPKGIPENCVPMTGNSGALLVAPLVRGDGSELLLLRGWYPLAALPRRGAGASEAIDAVCLLRAAEEPGSFAIAHHPEKDAFSWLDIDGIAQHVRLARGEGGAAPAPSMAASSALAPAGTAPAPAPAPPSRSRAAVMIEMIEREPAAPGRFPFTKQLASLADTYVMPFTHLVYASTWFTLGMCGAVITWSRFGRVARASRRAR